MTSLCRKEGVIDSLVAPATTCALLLAGSTLGPMELFVIILTVVAAGAALVYFLSSSRGMQLVRLKTVSSILNDIHAMRHAAPETALHDIYYALAEERTNKSQWLIEFEYLPMLRDAGCFDPRTAPEPQRFAELIASTEEKIRLQASGMAK